MLKHMPELISLSGSEQSEIIRKFYQPVVQLEHIHADISNYRGKVVKKPTQGLNDVGDLKQIITSSDKSTRNPRKDVLFRDNTSSDMPHLNAHALQIEKHDDQGGNILGKNIDTAWDSQFDSTQTYASPVTLSNGIRHELIRKYLTEGIISSTTDIPGSNNPLSLNDTRNISRVVDFSEKKNNSANISDNTTRLPANNIEQQKSDPSCLNNNNNKTEDNELSRYLPYFVGYRDGHPVVENLEGQQNMLAQSDTEENNTRPEKDCPIRNLLVSSNMYTPPTSTNGNMHASQGKTHMPKNDNPMHKKRKSKTEDKETDSPPATKKHATTNKRKTHKKTVKIVLYEKDILPDIPVQPDECDTITLDTDEEKNDEHDNDIAQRKQNISKSIDSTPPDNDSDQICSVPYVQIEECDINTKLNKQSLSSRPLYTRRKTRRIKRCENHIQIDGPVCEDNLLSMTNMPFEDTSSVRRDNKANPEAVDGRPASDEENIACSQVRSKRDDCKITPLVVQSQPLNIDDSSQKHCFVNTIERKSRRPLRRMLDDEIMSVPFRMLVDTTKKSVPAHWHPYLDDHNGFCPYKPHHDIPYDVIMKAERYSQSGVRRTPSLAHSTNQPPNVDTNGPSPVDLSFVIQRVSDDRLPTAQWNDTSTMSTTSTSDSRCVNNLSVMDLSLKTLNSQDLTTPFPFVIDLSPIGHLDTKSCEHTSFTNSTGETKQAKLCVENIGSTHLKEIAQSKYIIKSTLSSNERLNKANPLSDHTHTVAENLLKGETEHIPINMSKPKVTETHKDNKMYNHAARTINEETRMKTQTQSQRKISPKKPFEAISSLVNDLLQTYCCQICKKEDPRFVCSLCEEAWYCSKKCQREGWPVHWKLCK